jgi:hypothetical protein
MNILNHFNSVSGLICSPQFATSDFVTACEKKCAASIADIVGVEYIDIADEYCSDRCAIALPQLGYGAASIDEEVGNVVDVSDSLDRSVRASRRDVAHQRCNKRKQAPLLQRFDA